MKRPMLAFAGIPFLILAIYAAAYILGSDVTGGSGGRSRWFKWEWQCQFFGPAAAGALSRAAA